MVRAACATYAPTEATILRALKPKGRQAQVVQRHKAESDMAVAAASVIAREEFIRSANGLPLGSSDPKVAERACEMVRESGAKWLMNNAKAHFRTTDKVLAACGLSRDDLPPEGRVKSVEISNDKVNDNKKKEA